MSNTRVFLKPMTLHFFKMYQMLEAYDRIAFTEEYQPYKTGPVFLTKEHQSTDPDFFTSQIFLQYSLPEEIWNATFTNHRNGIMDPSLTYRFENFTGYWEFSYKTSAAELKARRASLAAFVQSIVPEEEESQAAWGVIDKKIEEAPIELRETFIPCDEFCKQTIIDARKLAQQDRELNKIAHAQYQLGGNVMLAAGVFALSQVSALSSIDSFSLSGLCLGGLDYLYEELARLNSQAEEARKTIGEIVSKHSMFAREKGRETILTMENYRVLKYSGRR